MGLNKAQSMHTGLKALPKDPVWETSYEIPLLKNLEPAMPSESPYRQHGPRVPLAMP